MQCRWWSWLVVAVVVLVVLNVSVVSSVLSKASVSVLREPVKTPEVVAKAQESEHRDSVGRVGGAAGQARQNLVVCKDRNDAVIYALGKEREQRRKVRPVTFAMPRPSISQNSSPRQVD